MVNDANHNLEEMVHSMKEINTSSEKISKIIRVIDEIAFQTNILALMRRWRRRARARRAWASRWSPTRCAIWRIAAPRRPRILPP